MLSLDRGQAMRFLTSRLRASGYNWAYRVVDTRAFGLPHRRRRVIILASRSDDPRDVLLSEDAGPGDNASSTLPTAFGFYWTEGNRGLGWAVDAVPTLKGGSGIGIPSPPAIWMRDGSIVTPDIRDAERLQGFPTDWTRPYLRVAGASRGGRWKLVGNAVSVPVAKWVGQRLLSPIAYNGTADEAAKGHKWPTAAWDMGSGIFRSDASEWPKRFKWHPLGSFLKHDATPLSHRAASGFFRRVSASRLSLADGFLDAIAAHVSQSTPED